MANRVLLIFVGVFLGCLQETGFVIVASTAKCMNVDSNISSRLLQLNNQINLKLQIRSQSNRTNKQGIIMPSQYASPTDGIKSANARIMAAIKKI